MLLENIAVFTQGRFRLFDIWCETIIDVLDKNTFKHTDKQQIISYVGKLQGSNAPSKTGIQNLLFHLRDVYKDNDAVLMTIATAMTE